MTGAELKVTLGGLGLPPSWFAERMDVTMRTVVRWFDGDPMPEGVAVKLAELGEYTLDEMRKMLAAAPRYVDGNRVLRTYRTDDEFRSHMPASWHRALTYRVVEHLRAEGETVVVEYE